MTEPTPSQPESSHAPPPPPPRETGHAQVAGSAGPSPTVHVVNQTAGFGRLVAAFIVALSILAIAFGLGIGAGFGILGTTAFFMSGSNFDQFVITSTYRDGSSRKIVILPVAGIIDGSRAEFVRTCIDELLEDRSVRAVVLRVESPGGSVTPSDQIWYEVQRLRNAGIPVVASFGSIAASGGYYVSCASDHIMAEETTITGSIGVIAQVFTLEELMDKVGVEPVTLVAAKSPDKMVANDIFRSWDERDRDQMTQMLDSAYEIFARRVRAGRADVIATDGQFDEIATGSIFTAEDALAKGLVDSIGYLDDAIGQAESLAGLTRGSATVEEFLERPMLLGGLPLLARGGPRAPEKLDAERIRSLVNDLGTVRLMYLMK